VPDFKKIFADALKHHQAGRFAEAERLYREILASDERHADSLHLLGLIALQQRRFEDAAEQIRLAIRARGDVPAYHNNLGIVLLQGSDLAAAQARFEQALALNPAYAEASYNLGVALELQGRSDDARPHYARAQTLKPDYADALVAQAVALQRHGRSNEAMVLYRRALALHPGHVGACNNLGAALQTLDRLEEAMAQYRRALALDPLNADACNNLASALARLDDFRGALEYARKALDLRDNPKTRRVLVECFKYIDATQLDDGGRDLLRRALSEVWARPAELAPSVIAAVKRGSAVASCLEQPRRPAVTDLGRIADDGLLVCLLRSAPVCDPEVERLLTGCRATLLDEVSRDPPADEMAGPLLDFACALAEQCFVNEYVFACSEEEARLILDLERRIAAGLVSGQTLPSSWVVTLAAYKPLLSVAGADRLLERSWPTPVDALLGLQVSAPLEERRYQGEIERLTPISDSVSLMVRQQYEENPYPRWMKLPDGTAVQSLDEMLVSNLPKAVFRPLGARVPDVLIAGCGTGLHSISTARLHPAGNVLAVDLSCASLAYAVRKTRELGLRNVRYAQADILELGSIGRQFDLIESSGVLHHLGKPLAGLEVLASLLRPNGLMKLALYSELARKPIVEIRRLIAAQGYGANAEDIRRCRQEIKGLAQDDLRRKVLTFNDFYSMSECRDLLFHAQEHRLTLPVIAGWLERLGLTFVTFDVPYRTEQAFGVRFPDPAAWTDLGSWHRYEQDHPNTFIGMYQFWVQKAEG
jgi:Flp pilus assembly protein TadD/SAM-dependent methyltransferase